MQSQGFQCFCAGAQQESRPAYVEDIPVTKSDSPERVNHVLQRTGAGGTHRPRSGGTKSGMGVASSLGSSWGAALP